MDKKGNIYYYKSLKNEAPIAIRVPGEIKEELAKIAEERGEKLSDITRDALLQLVCDHYNK